jgi:hypothetical protein
MLNFFGAVVLSAVLVATVLAFPGSVLTVEARETTALAKGDSLRAAMCSTQVWPNFTSSCLRSQGSGSSVLQVRLVSSDR